MYTNNFYVLLICFKLCIVIISESFADSSFVGELTEIEFDGNINLIGKYSDLENSKIDSDGQFQTFDLGIDLKYFDSPNSFIFLKSVLDFRDELNSNTNAGCIGNEDCVRNTNDSIEPDSAEELRIGYSRKNLAASIGKIPAYAETIDISESYDFFSFAAFDDEVITRSQQNNDIIVRGEWIHQELNLIADVNLAVDKDDTKQDVLKGGATVEFVPGTTAIVSIGVKDSYSVLFGEDITTFGITIEDIFYDQRENSDKAWDISLAGSRLGAYLNTSFSYYKGDYVKISVGADFFNVSKDEFEEIGRVGSDRSLIYLNYTVAFGKSFKLFTEVNHAEFGGNKAASYLIGIGSHF